MPKNRITYLTYFSCSNPDYVMWRDQQPLLEDKYYEVECGLGGLFQLSATEGPLISKGHFGVFKCKKEFCPRL